MVLAVEHGDARGVVAPVFQSLERIEQNFLRVTESDIADNAAHNHLACESVRNIIASF